MSQADFWKIHPNLFLKFQFSGHEVNRFLGNSSMPHGPCGFHEYSFYIISSFYILSGQETNWFLETSSNCCLCHESWLTTQKSLNIFDLLNLLFWTSFSEIGPQKSRNRSTSCPVTLPIRVYIEKYLLLWFIKRGP